MEIVAGINLKSLEPRVWKQDSPYYLPNLKAVMISYADFHRMSKNRRLAMEKGIHEFLGVPKTLKIYLDNGSFYFFKKEQENSIKDYEEFVKNAKPDWYPIPQDFIPTPKMSLEEQEICFTRTMEMNIHYQHRKYYFPVIHISNYLEDYIEQIKSHPKLFKKPVIALGGIVPNLLKTSKARPHKMILESLQRVREEFKHHRFHVFGIGGTSTLHIAALLGIDSCDSSGWRNRAVRGLIQLPGTGDRIIADLGSWRGRRINDIEREKLRNCQCPSCQQYGIEGLEANKMHGFVNRATHNLWILLEEVRQIEEYLPNLESYQEWYQSHLDNTIYRPLITEIIRQKENVSCRES